ncbi:hypothetical protein [Halostella sp. PRR32]|uniref:hypothetical protein n=1 Tax=Halostella sp. PRR32 TaxID=3098147 RepID=UPI002B1CF282|nr:hypothetical protein [Halostella sp. PRR32]
MRLDGVSRIETDHEGDTVDVVVDDDVSDGALTAAVEATGYDVAAESASVCLSPIPLPHVFNGEL